MLVSSLGLDFVRGWRRLAAVASGRPMLPDDRAGARPACYLDVYLNGALVFDSSRGSQQLLFDANSLTPDAVESIEIYIGAAQVPARYNKASAGCGVMVIWTRG